MPNKQKRHSREFKLEAVRLVQGSGKPHQVAHDLGIDVRTLNHWCKQWDTQGNSAFMGRGHQQTKLKQDNFRQEVEESKVKQEAPKETNASVSAIPTPQETPKETNASASAIPTPQEAPKETTVSVNTIPTSNVSSTANIKSDTIITPSRGNQGNSRFSFLIDKKRINAFLYHCLRRFAKWWKHLFWKIVATIFLGIIGIIVGINTFASPPLIDILHRYPTESFVLVVGLAVVTLIAFFFSPRSKQKNEVVEEPILKFNWSTVIAPTTLIICIIFFLVILIQPPWCPALFCPTPKVVTNSQGWHDNNILEAYFTTLQSVSFVIPNNPTQYTLNNLPKSTGAVLLGKQESHTLYKVVLGVHSLQQGRFGLYIEQVAIVIRQVPVIPSPLNIWTAGDVLEYNSNPYEVLYLGQNVGDTLPATNVKPPYAPVQLAPGEADELDLQIISTRAVDLRFSVQITYRVTDEGNSQILTLPKIFEVIFSNASNWHPFSLQQDGHFKASS